MIVTRCYMMLHDFYMSLHYFYMILYYLWFYMTFTWLLHDFYMMSHDVTWLLYDFSCFYMTFTWFYMFSHYFYMILHSFTLLILFYMILHYIYMRPHELKGCTVTWTTYVCPSIEINSQHGQYSDTNSNFICSLHIYPLIIEFIHSLQCMASSFPTPSQAHTTSAHPCLHSIDN